MTNSGSKVTRKCLVTCSSIRRKLLPVEVDEDEDEEEEEEDEFLVVVVDGGLIMIGRS